MPTRTAAIVPLLLGSVLGGCLQARTAAPLEIRPSAPSRRRPKPFLNSVSDY
jgi:hypothetical protein